MNNKTSRLHGIKVSPKVHFEFWEIIKSIRSNSKKYSCDFNVYIILK